MPNVHIWCPRFSNSAVNICNSLREKGVNAYKSPRNPRNLQRFLTRVKQGDLWINWGAPRFPTVPGVRCLNTTPALNKRTQLLKLAAAGVQTLEVSNTAQEGWIGRAFNHQKGLDLLNNTGQDYWTRQLDFKRELRIHIYKGKSIHAGIKVPRIDNPHPWIRSYDSGWKIDYARAKDIADNRREIAKNALEALSLDFGAVDIGITRSDNQPVIIEVNTAPGLESGPSVEVYVKKFLEELVV